MKLKIESDLFYEKYRTHNNIEKQLSKEEYDNYRSRKAVYEEKWSRILEERDFKALRAEVSSLKNSISSSLGSISENDTGLDVKVQEEPLNSLNGNVEISNNRPVGVNTNSLRPTSSSSLSSESTSQTRKNNNQRTYTEIAKDSASLRHNKVYNLKTINDLVNNALTNIMNKFSNAKSVRIPNGKSSLINKSFKELNLAKDLDLAVDNVANMIEESIITFDNGVGNSIQQVKIGDLGYKEDLRKQSNNIQYC